MRKTSRAFHSYFFRVACNTTHLQGTSPLVNNHHHQRCSISFFVLHAIDQFVIVQTLLIYLLSDCIFEKENFHVKTSHHVSWQYSDLGRKGKEEEGITYLELGRMSVGLSREPLAVDGRVGSDPRVT
jgi:hypothetical protein